MRTSKPATRRSSRTVIVFFRYRVGNDQLAEDLTAETLEKA
jgi:DNA-directed RNA polymerase specialized sigma24 family protein